MATLSAFLNPLHHIQMTFFTRDLRQPSPAIPQDDSDATRDRMGFIGERLLENSNAFASDIDVQGMMHLFPDRF